MTLTGDEKCTNCKEVPFPRGFDAAQGLCWWCCFDVVTPLSPAQRASVEASWKVDDATLA